MLSFTVCASTTRSWSVSTRVGVPASSIVGRNVAAGAERDVGAINTVLRSSSSSACTTTPGRAPCCSCPRARRGAPSRTTSPRTISQPATAERARQAPRVAPPARRDLADLPPAGAPPLSALHARAGAHAPRSGRFARPASRSSLQRARPRAPPQSRHRAGHGEHATQANCTTNHATSVVSSRAHGLATPRPASPPNAAPASTSDG
jgi:hypothetical protein